MPRDPRVDQHAQTCQLVDFQVIGCLFPQRIARLGQLLGAGQTRLKRDAKARPVVLKRPRLKRAKHQHVHNGDAWVRTNRHVERRAHAVAEEGLCDPHALHVAAAFALHLVGHGTERGVPVVRHAHHRRLQCDRMRSVQRGDGWVVRRDRMATAGNAASQGDEPAKIEGNCHAARTQAPKLTANRRFHMVNVTGGRSPIY